MTNTLSKDKCVFIKQAFLGQFSTFEFRTISSLWQQINNLLKTIVANSFSNTKSDSFLLISYEDILFIMEKTSFSPDMVALLVHHDLQSLRCLHFEHFLQTSMDKERQVRPPHQRHSHRLELEKVNDFFCSITYCISCVNLMTLSTKIKQKIWATISSNRE